MRVFRLLLSGITFLLVADRCCAQADIDSLRRTSDDRSLPDSVRLLALFDLAWEGYLFSEPDSAFLLGERLKREAIAARNKGFEARSSELKAAVWYVRGDMRTALLHYDSALASHERNNDMDGQADVITNMAAMRSSLGERDEALRLFHKGLGIHTSINDSSGIANDLNAIGTVYMARGEPARAATYYVRSLRMQEALGDDRGIATGRANMGTLLVQQGDYAEALVHYREALKLAERMDNRHLMGKDHEEIGVCLIELGDTSAAMNHFGKSLDLRKGLEDGHGTVNVQNRMAEILLMRGQADDALALYTSSAAMATELGLPWGLGHAHLGAGRALLALGRKAEALAQLRKAEYAATESDEFSLQRDVAQGLCEVLRSHGKWKEALDAQTQVIALNDSVLREENQREVLKNEFRYANELEARSDSLAYALSAQKESAKSAERLDHERYRRNVALGVGAILALVLLGLWQRARLLKRTNAEILNAQNKLVESERAREANEVRIRIARDVHDQLGSDLTKLSMLSSEVKVLVKEDPAALAQAAQDIERVAGEANRSLGDIVWAIDPHHDSLAGLTERVRLHCERMLKWSHVQHSIDCAHTGPDRSLDPATKRDIYLILREALNNAIKYAEATHIRVVLHTNARSVHLMVQDDGKGFSAAGTPPGHGLANMRARADRMGATLLMDGNIGSTLRLDLALTA